MSRERLVYGFHAVAARLRQDPAGVKEVYVVHSRDDARSRDIAALAAERGVRVVPVPADVGALVGAASACAGTAVGLLVGGACPGGGVVHPHTVDMENCRIVHCSALKSPASAWSWSSAQVTSVPPIGSCTTTSGLPIVPPPSPQTLHANTSWLVTNRDGEKADRHKRSIPARKRRAGRTGRGAFNAASEVRTNRPAVGGCTSSAVGGEPVVIAVIVVRFIRYTINQTIPLVEVIQLLLPVRFGGSSRSLLDWALMDTTGQTWSPSVSHRWDGHRRRHPE